MTFKQFQICPLTFANFQNCLATFRKFQKCLTRFAKFQICPTCQVFGGTMVHAIDYTNHETNHFQLQTNGFRQVQHHRRRDITVDDVFRLRWRWQRTFHNILPAFEIIASKMSNISHHDNKFREGHGSHDMCHDMVFEWWDRFKTENGHDIAGDTSWSENRRGGPGRPRGGSFGGWRGDHELIAPDIEMGTNGLVRMSDLQWHWGSCEWCFRWEMNQLARSNSTKRQMTSTSSSFGFHRVSTSNKPS